jgi:hypothetical protein
MNRADGSTGPGECTFRANCRNARAAWSRIEGIGDASERVALTTAGGETRGGRR